MPRLPILLLNIINQKMSTGGMLSKIVEILESGDSANKISVLEGLVGEDRPDIIEKMIARLDDNNIQVRGEAFSSLVLNKNHISGHLIKSLNSGSRNIRGFVSLILANRNETVAIPDLIRLAGDERSMVRSCAVGALGHLHAGDAGAGDVMLKLLLDKNVDVKKSAAHAVVTNDVGIPRDLMERVSVEWVKDTTADPELGMLLERLEGCVRR